MTERRTFRTYLPASNGHTVARVREQAAEAGCEEMFSQVVSDVRGTSVMMELEGEAEGLGDVESVSYLGILGAPKPGA